MSVILQPWQFLLLILAGWINRQLLPSVRFSESMGIKPVPERRRQKFSECSPGSIHAESQGGMCGSDGILRGEVAGHRDPSIPRVMGEETGHTAGEVHCRERLGGLLKYYYREAA